MNLREPREVDESEQSFEEREAAYYARIDEANAQLAATRANIAAWFRREPKTRDIIMRSRRI